jgi:Skp family chaperone for outer membrane proteins
MIKLVTASVLALSLATGAALAQTAPTAPPATGSSPPLAAAPTAPKADGGDAAVIAKFKAADKNANGALDGAEVDAFKADLVKIDTDKDGKISQVEYVSATKAGVIK